MTDTIPLQLIRAQVSVRDFQRWMGQKRLQDSDHAMHCLLAECFGPDLAPQPFRLILPRGGAQGTLYGYGSADAAALREQAAIFADPAQSRILPADYLESKAMPAAWQAGQRLGFEVRIRPIVRRRNFNSADPGKAREWDAFLWAVEQLPPGGEMRQSREQVYREWLQEELTRRGGAELAADSVSLRSFQRVRAVRKLRARPGEVSEGPDAVMQGNLTITEPEKFARLLARGVGRHRAYGYGMLLLRPLRRPAAAAAGGRDGRTLTIENPAPPARG